MIYDDSIRVLADAPARAVTSAGRVAPCARALARISDSGEKFILSADAARDSNHVPPLIL